MSKPKTSARGRAAGKPPRFGSKKYGTPTTPKMLKHGPGFYVTNGKDSVAGMMGFGKKYVAEEGPFYTFEEAVVEANKKLQFFLQMGFRYLLPVRIVDAPSRRDAEYGEGTEWWINGKRKAKPEPAEQTRFAGMAKGGISPGDTITYIDGRGEQRRGRAVMRGSHGWVVNLGGRHGTPGVVDDEKIIRVTKSKR